jgi:hypothetical protein
VLLSSCCCWRSATSRKLVPFSHRSASRIFIRQPNCIPSPMVTRDGDHQFDGGEKQAGLWPPPRPQLQGSSSSLLGRRARRAGACLRVGWRPASSSGFWGWKPSSSSVEEVPSSHAGEGELLLPSQGAAFCPLSGQRWPAAPGVSQHVIRREGGTRVLGRSHSRFRGEDGSEDLPVRFGVAGARWCGVGGWVDAAAGAEVVAAGESFSADETVSATRGPTSGSLALIACPRPSSGDASEGLVTAASALRSSLLLFSRPEWRSLSLLTEWATASHLEFHRPAGPPMWGVVRTCGSGTGVPFVMAP